MATGRSDDQSIAVRPALAWGFLKGFGMLVAGLSITLLLATILQSRAETRQEVADASIRNQAMAADPAFAMGAPKQKLAPVKFTPDLVAGR
jgi:hypothetical protein